ncbi:MAG: heavy-metal-associated domain-containing protein [Oscillospiraceae bacterium]
MTVLNVPDMHCEHCVSRITKVLTDAGLDFSVSLENKTVTINGCENCVATAKSELEDIGFDSSEA